MNVCPPCAPHPPQNLQGKIGGSVQVGGGGLDTPSSKSVTPFICQTQKVRPSKGISKKIPGAWHWNPLPGLTPPGSGIFHQGSTPCQRPLGACDGVGKGHQGAWGTMVGTDAPTKAKSKKKCAPSPPPNQMKPPRPFLPSAPGKLSPIRSIRTDAAATCQGDR